MTGQHNAETELIAQLSSDKRSVKIQAIVKLTRAGQTELALRALLPFIKSDDREISFFANQAAGKIAQKAGLNLDDFLEGSAHKDNANTSGVLTAEVFLSPPAEKVTELLNFIRQSAEQIPEEILPAVGVFLNRHGDISDAPFIEKQLLKDSSNLALPYLNAAENVAAVILPRVLPGLLASREPLVRSRAVSALRRIDPEEAERHFSDLLASRNPEDRLAGIGIALLFPFERVKGYLLSLLPEERDPEVLTACQTVLATNPEADTALSVLDIIDSVVADQKSRLTQIFKTICKAIGSAGIMPVDQATPENFIKQWKQQRLQSFLDNLEIQLACADDGRKKAIIDWIQKNRQHPRVVELIDRLGQNPQTEDVYKTLAAGSQPIQAKKSEKRQPEQAADQVPLDENARLEILKTIEIEGFSEHKVWICEEAARGAPRIRAQALNTLLRLRPDIKMKDLARSALDTEDSEVRIAGFKMLERIDPDYLKEKVAGLLLENDPNLRVRAVRFGLKFEEKASIEALKNLLNSKEQNIRSNAINCLALCPFNLVFKTLMDQLDREDHPVIARQIASILLNNPSKSVLKALDNVTRTSNPAVSMVISQARNDLFEIVSQMPVQPEPEATSRKTDSADKPYSVSNVREIAQRNQNWKPSYKADTKSSPSHGQSEINWQMLISGSVILIFLAMLPVMMLSSRDVPETSTRKAAELDYRVSERVKPVEAPVPVKFRMNRACSLSGTVEKIVSDTSLVMVHETSQMMVKFDKPEVKPFKQGDKITVTVVPYRVNPHGVILSRGQRIAAAEK